MAVNNGNSQNLPKGWMKKSIPPGIQFSHETDTNSCSNIQNNGIDFDKSRVGLCSMGQGFYAYQNDDEISFDDDAERMILLKSNAEMTGYEVDVEDFAKGDGDATVATKYKQYESQSDFYTFDREFVFHPNAKQKLKIINVKKLK